MLSANCSAVGDELFRRLSVSGSRRLSPIGSAVLARLHALQTVSAQRSQSLTTSDEEARRAGQEEADGMELSCEFDEAMTTSAADSSDDSSSSCECGRFDWSGAELSAAELSAAVDCVHRLAVSADCVWLESVVMQVEFETLYALTLHCRDIDRQRSEAAQQRRVDELLAIDIRAAQSATQQSVVAFYSTLFQLCLQSPAVTSDARSDRQVQREVAAAVESVFPLSHLHEHSLRDVAERRRELTGLSDLVLGIRLFNQQIGKGGARLHLRPAALSAEMTDHIAQLEQESVFIGEIAHTYTTLLANFHNNHGHAQNRQRRQEEEKQQIAQYSTHSGASIHSSRSATAAAASLSHFPSCLLDAARVHSELIHRRQYLLFLHALQSEGAAALSAVQSLSQQLDALFSQLTSIVGLRAAVPKQQVFPAFEQVGRLYRQLADEASKSDLRQRLLSQLQDSRNPFITSLTTAHIRQCKEMQQADTKQKASPDAQLPKRAEFDAFVATLDDTQQTEGDNTAAAASASGTDADSRSSTARTSSAMSGISASDECVRVTADGSASFMSVALAYQGYCCVTLVRHAGFLLAGDAALGVIRYRQAHFAFATIAAMRAFVSEPQRFIQAVQMAVAVRHPALIHLLCLQTNIPHTDIALYITDKVVQAAHKHTSASANTSGSGSTASHSKQQGAASFFPPLKHAMQAAVTQTPTHFPPSSGDESGLQSVHWNEWEMRRRAVQMADMRSKVTHSTQTDKSHFRRDNSSQYTLPNRTADGTVDAKGTQTRIDKSTNSERTVAYVAGLRTDPKQQSHTTNITLTLPSLVGEPTNPALNNKAQWAAASAHVN